MLFEDIGITIEEFDDVLVDGLIVYCTTVELVELVELIAETILCQNIYIF